MTATARAGCPSSWPGSWTTARRRSSSRWASRRRWSRGGSSSTASPPREGWAAEPSSSPAKAAAIVRPHFPDGVAVFDYAPFSELFPRAAAVVHAGGVGTSGLAMRSGRPMLVVPHAHDQPENAQRLARLGIARSLPPPIYPGPRRRRADGLLDDPAFARRAAEVGETRPAGRRRGAACDALEELLREAHREES